MYRDKVRFIRYHLFLPIAQKASRLSVLTATATKALSKKRKLGGTNHDTVEVVMQLVHEHAQELLRVVLVISSEKRNCLANSRLELVWGDVCVVTSLALPTTTQRSPERISRRHSHATPTTHAICVFHLIHSLQPSSLLTYQRRYP